MQWTKFNWELVNRMINLQTIGYRMAQQEYSTLDRSRSRSSRSFQLIHYFNYIVSFIQRHWTSDKDECDKCPSADISRTFSCWSLLSIYLAKCVDNRNIENCTLYRQPLTLLLPIPVFMSVTEWVGAFYFGQSF